MPVLSISETVNNGAADTDYEFENLNKQIPPPQDLSKQLNDALRIHPASRAENQISSDATTLPVNAFIHRGARLHQQAFKAFDILLILIMDSQVPTKQASK